MQGYGVNEIIYLYWEIHGRGLRYKKILIFTRTHVGEK